MSRALFLDELFIFFIYKAFFARIPRNYGVLPDAPSSDASSAAANADLDQTYSDWGNHVDDEISIAMVPLSM